MYSKLNYLEITMNNSTVVLDMSQDTTCDQLLQGHTRVPDVHILMYGLYRVTTIMRLFA